MKYRIALVPLFEEHDELLSLKIQLQIHPDKFQIDGKLIAGENKVALFSGKKYI